MRWRSSIAAALALAVAAPAPAHADDRGDAEALYRVGERAFNAAHYADAADTFEQAYAKLPLPAIAFSLAQAHRLQYFIDNQPAHLKRAVELYHLYIDQQKDGGRIADAATNLGTIEPLLRQLEASGVAMGAMARTRTTRLVVSTDVVGAKATVDGTSGTVPFVREVTPGPHAVAIEAEGYVAYHGTALAIDGEMVPVEPALAPQPAALVIDAPRGAHVVIDGRAAGDAPLGKLELPAGPHLVVITQRGHMPIARDLVLARGNAQRIAAPLATTRQRKVARGVLIGGGALVVAAGVAGLVTYSASSDASADHDRIVAGNASEATLAHYQKRRAERDADLPATEALAGVALAALVTGAALYWFDDRAPEAPRKLEITPTVSASGAGAALAFRF